MFADDRNRHRANMAHMTVKARFLACRSKCVNHFKMFPRCSEVEHQLSLLKLGAGVALALTVRV